MNNPNVAHDPTQIKDTQTGEQNDFYALVRRDLVSQQNLSDRAFRVFCLLDSHLVDKTRHIKRETLMKSWPWHISKLDRGLAELTELGLLKKVRHTGSNQYTLPNSRVKYRNNPSQVSKSAESELANMQTSNRNNIKEIQSKNKQTEDALLSSLSSSAVKASPAVSARPFFKLKDEDQGYLKAFRDALRESSNGLYLDITALSSQNLKALLKAKENDLKSADDLAHMCGNWLEHAKTIRAKNNQPAIANEIGFLIKALPAILDGEGEATPRVLRTSNFPSVTEALTFPVEWVSEEPTRLPKEEMEETWKTLEAIKQRGKGRV
jgi:hypothetical protein